MQKLKLTEFVLTVAIAAVAPFALADSPVLSATLSIAPSEVLPGLPAAFLVTLKNPSNQPLQIYDAMSLTATTQDGTFEVEGVDKRLSPGLPEDQTEKCEDSFCLTVPALATRQLYIDIDPSLVGNVFFADPRLTVPGTYGLQMTFLSAAADGSDVSIKTNVANLTVKEPSGIDAEVWKWLIQLNDGKPWTAYNWGLAGDGTAPALRSRFPTSEYSRWVAQLGGPSWRQQLTNIDAALATNPPPSLHDMLLWAKGSVLAQENEIAIYSERDLQHAVALADAATVTLTALHDSAISDLLRQKATAKIAQLDTLKTGDATLRQLASEDPPSPAAVIPHVDCVTKGDGQTFSAHFGYSNPNKTQKVLQLSNLNEVTPAPRDQGEPRVFKPGEHSNVFVATSPGGNLIWHLDGNTATATADFATPCPTDSVLAPKVMSSPR